MNLSIYEVSVLLTLIVAAASLFFNGRLVISLTEWIVEKLLLFSGTLANIFCIMQYYFQEHHFLMLLLKI